MVLSLASVCYRMSKHQRVLALSRDQLSETLVSHSKREHLRLWLVRIRGGWPLLVTSELLKNMRLIRLLLCAGLLCASFVFAHGADVEARGPSVWVNGREVLRLRAEIGGLTPEIRAELIANALGGIQDPRLVEIKTNGRDHLILVEGQLVATVALEDAQKQKTTTADLARAWAARLDQALAMPPLKIAVVETALPLGEAKIIAITGSQARNATFESTNNEVVTVERAVSGMRLRGKGLGQATVIAKSGDSAQMLDVRVRPWAASLPKTLKAEVTGAPATGSSVRGAIAYALRTFIRTQPRGQVEFDESKAGALGAGRTASYRVHVKATAPESFEREGLVEVAVHNVPLAKQPDQQLWYCNSPEVVKRPQSVFAAQLRQDVPVRMLYHHVNGSSISMYMRIQAINESNEPAKVRVLIGDADPDRDPVRAGVDAGVKYLRSWMSGSGEILTIPPRSTVPISFRRLSPTETASGLCSIRLVSGPENVLIRTDFWPPYDLDPRWKDAERSMTPWREVGANAINVLDTSAYEFSEHIYPQPYKHEEVRYEVGGRYGFVRIGQKPIAREDQTMNLDGNFGVIYNINASILNPTQTTTDVEVVFEASAGYSGGLFVVNGVLERTPLLHPKQEARIARLRLQPGAQKLMSITTMPLSGSSYPATITVRPVQTTFLQGLLDRRN